jgi:hypothetical protein
MEEIRTGVISRIAEDKAGLSATNCHCLHPRSLSTSQEARVGCVDLETLWKLSRLTSSVIGGEARVYERLTCRDVTLLARE